MGDVAVKTARIRTKEKCPKGHQPFQTLPNGLICLEHLTVPKKLFLDVYWKGEGSKSIATKPVSYLPLGTWRCTKTTEKYAHADLKHLRDEIGKVSLFVPKTPPTHRDRENVK